MKIEALNLRSIGKEFTGIYYDGSIEVGSRLVCLTRLRFVPEVLDGRLSGNLLDLSTGGLLKVGQYLIYDGIEYSVVSGIEFTDRYTILSRYYILL